ncbi:hypothetical protein [Vulcanisaeta souniana]|uniref:hypothetical protein n=1 Tax=Vulcanisaeta souniana TaxID=164452 RepID=UPI000A6E32B4|nr:hypothetical protein [Vulcanisaeta souniana]
MGFHEVVNRGFVRNYSTVLANWVGGFYVWLTPVGRGFSFHGVAVFTTFRVLT